MNAVQVTPNAVGGSFLVSLRDRPWGTEMTFTAPQEGTRGVLSWDPPIPIPGLVQGMKVGAIYCHPEGVRSLSFPTPPVPITFTIKTE